MQVDLYIFFVLPWLDDSEQKPAALHIFLNTPFLMSSLTGDSGAGTIIVTAETMMPVEQDQFDNLPVDQQAKTLYTLVKVRELMKRCLGTEALEVTSRDSC